MPQSCKSGAYPEDASNYERKDETELGNSSLGTPAASDGGAITIFEGWKVTFKPVKEREHPRHADEVRLGFVIRPGMKKPLNTEGESKWTQAVGQNLQSSG